MQKIEPIIDNTLKELIAELELNLKKIFKEKLRKIIVFGSYARNTQEIGSDLDIMVLLDLDETELKDYREQLLDVNVELTTRYGIVLSIITNSYNHFNEWVEYMPFFKAVQTEGIEVYGR